MGVIIIVIAFIAVTLSLDARWHLCANEPVAEALIQLPDASAARHDIPRAPNHRVAHRRFRYTSVARFPSVNADRRPDVDDRSRDSAITPRARN